MTSLSLPDGSLSLTFLPDGSPSLRFWLNNCAVFVPLTHPFGSKTLMSYNRLCHNAQVRTDLVDLAVRAEVRGLLEHPQRLIEEYQRRLRDPGQKAHQAD